MQCFPKLSYLKIFPGKKWSLFLTESYFFFLQAEFVSAYNDLISGLQSSLRQLSTISGDLEKLVSLDQLSDVQYKFSALDLTGCSDPYLLHLEDGDHIQVHHHLFGPLNNAQLYFFYLSYCPLMPGPA